MTTAGGHYLIHCHPSPSRRTGRRQTSIRLHRGPPRTLGASRKTSVAGKKQARDHRPVTSGHRRDHGVDAGGEGTLNRRGRPRSETGGDQPRRIYSLALTDLATWRFSSDRS